MPGPMHPLDLIGISRIEQDHRMEIAVAGMKHVGVPQAVAVGDRGNLSQGVGQSRAGHRTVGHEETRCQPGDRAKRSSPARPQPVSFGRIFRPANLTAAVLQTQLANPLRLLLQSGQRAVHLDDQHGPGIQRIAAGLAALDSPNHGSIHHLQRRRSHARSHHGRHRASRVRHVVVDHQHRQQRLRRGQDANHHLGHDGQRSFAAHQDPAHVVAGWIQSRAADLQHLAARQHRCHPQHVVRGHPVLHTMRSARIFGQVSAQRRRFLAGGVRREQETAWGERCCNSRFVTPT